MSENCENCTRNCAGNNLYNFGGVRAERDFVFNNHSSPSEPGNEGRRDVFCPSFYEDSPNPSEVLNFGNPFDDTEPSTPEAKVLRKILHTRVNEEKTSILTINGKPGVGKSCILHGLGHKMVQEKFKMKEHFPGGIFFLKLGMSATESTLIRGLASITEKCGGEKLGQELRGEENLDMVLEKMGEWMKGKKCLALFDDVWERNGLGKGKVQELSKIFSADSGSVLVMTTRFTFDSTNLGSAIEIEERGTMSEEAKAILLGHAKQKEIKDEELEAFDKVLQVCGGLPLFLSAVGRTVAERSKRLKSKKPEKSASESKSVWVLCWKQLHVLGQVEMFRMVNDKYQNLCETLQLSLEVLSKRQGTGLGSLLESEMTFQDMHRALCVFKKQVGIPVSVCRRLWKAKKNEGAFQIGEWFAQIGLADIETGGLGGSSVEYIRLHDVAHMFALKCATVKGEVAEWHGQLLKGYNAKETGNGKVRKWWELWKEGSKDVAGYEYLFENICRHLVSSGNVKEVERLLVSGEWSKLRLKIGGLSAWEGDFWECLEGMKEHPDHDGGTKCERKIERGLEMVRDAVIDSWGIVHENPRELGYQVLGRLLDCENEVVKRYLSSIEEVECTPWLRPMQRCLERPGVRAMIGEFDLSRIAHDSDNIVRDIALHKESFTAVVGVGKEVVIISLKEMRVTGRCAGHTRRVRKVGISSDGKRAFSWADDGTVRQWNVESGKEYKDNYIQLDDEESEEDDRVLCATFSPDSSFVVTGSENGKIEVWDLRRGRRVGCTLEAPESVNCLRASPNGRIVAAGLRKGSVLLLSDVQTSNPTCRELNGRMRIVECIPFNEDGRLLASCELDNRIRLWDVKSIAQFRDPFVRCEEVPCSVAFSEDSTQILSGNRNGSISVWDVENGTVMRSWRAHTSKIRCVAVISNTGSRWALSGGADGTLRVWDLQAEPDERSESVYHEKPVTCVAASPDGRVFVSGSTDKTLRIWDGREERPPEERPPKLALCKHEGDVECTTVSPNRQRVVSGSRNCTLYVWDVETCDQVGDAVRKHEKRITCVTYSPNGEFVVSGSNDRTVRVWSVMDYCESGGCVGEPPRQCIRVEELLSRAHPESSNQKPLRLKMTLRHELADEESDWSGEVSSVAVSPDGQRVLSGLQNGEIWLWDMKSGRCIDRQESSSDGSVAGQQSNNDRSIVRIEVSEASGVLTTNRRNETMRWRLENGGLTSIPHGGEGTEIAQAGGSQEGSVTQELSRVACHGRIVQLGCSGQKIATLSDSVEFGAWAYNAQRKVLCVGDSDGRVLFFKVKC